MCGGCAHACIHLSIYAYCDANQNVELYVSFIPGRREEASQLAGWLVGWNWPSLKLKNLNTARGDDWMAGWMMLTKVFPYVLFLLLIINVPFCFYPGEPYCHAYFSLTGHVNKDYFLFLPKLVMAIIVKHFSSYYCDDQSRPYFICVLESIYQTS